MRILQAVHGYPPRFSAGSEIYTQTLSREQAKRHQVMVFSRFEDPFLRPYSILDEIDSPSNGGAAIPVRLVNMANFRDRYRHEEVDRLFEATIREFRPDVIHIQHLNHLSSSVIQIAEAMGVPTIYTLHDFWLMCPRGQFIQFFGETQSGALPLCNGQEHAKCAERCYSRYYSGDPDQADNDMRYFTEWVQHRMEHMREMASQIACFIAPSRHLEARFCREFEIPQNKVRYLDYGFDLKRLSGRCRSPRSSDEFVFGYIGTHVATKGIHQLLEAFAKIKRSDTRLKIWGRSSDATPALRAFSQRMPPSVRDRISWEGEYSNDAIVRDIFNNVDVIVVPSIWLENSPLVIHEAQQARVPVITADAGGMAELVRHEVNGLLFRHRDSASLSEQMERCLDNPTWIANLGVRGCLHSEGGDVSSIEDHSQEIEEIYRSCISGKYASAREAQR